jgi:death-on-curing protein
VIKDAGIRDSALHRPQNAYHYADPPPDIIRLAAIYAIAIGKAHAFNDGNKRTAFSVCAVFLMDNGYAFEPPPDEAVEMFVNIADDEHTGIGEQEVADGTRRYARPVELR